MKRLTISFILLGTFCWRPGLMAQTWDELFRQKETQKEYLLLQAGALRIQSGLLREAGRIAEMGLTTISSWRDLEKGLHEDFFFSFRTLGPLSSHSLDRLKQFGLHPTLLRERILKSQARGLNLSKDELFHQWNSKVHQGMLRRCDYFLAELNLILGNNLEMQDGDRAALLDSLGKDIQQLHRDLAQLQKSVQFRLAQQKQRDYQIQLLNRF